MSYRHYINVVDKVTAIMNINEVNRMAEKYRNNGGEEDIGFMDVIKTLGGTNVYELGKYSDEGYALEKSVSADIPFPLKHCFQNLHDVAEEHECGFNVISREDLVSVIESYNKNTIEYLEESIKEGTTKELVESILTWKNYLINTSNKKWIVQDSWKYMFAVYDLIHILKTVDWENQFVFVTGW